MVRTPSIRLSDFIAGLVRETLEGVNTSLSDQVDAENQLMARARMPLDEAAALVDNKLVNDRLGELTRDIDRNAGWAKVCQTFVLRLRDDLGISLQTHEDFSDRGLTRAGLEKIALEVRRDIARNEIDRARQLLEAGAPRLRVNGGEIAAKAGISLVSDPDSGGFTISVTPAADCSGTKAACLSTLKFEFQIR